MIDGCFQQGSRGLIASVKVAKTFIARCRGLLGRTPLEEGEGLWIIPCGSIHTVGMQYTLDAVFLDIHNRIVKITRHVSPGHVVWGGWSAHSVIEVRSGWLPADLGAGERITWVPPPA